MKFEFLCWHTTTWALSAQQHPSVKIHLDKNHCKATCISTQTGLETYTRKTKEVAVFLTCVSGVGGFCLIFSSSQLFKNNFLDCLWQLCLPSHKEAYAIWERKLRGSCWEKAKLVESMHFTFKVSFECSDAQSKHFSYHRWPIYVIFYR